MTMLEDVLVPYKGGSEEANKDTYDTDERARRMP
jgi:hypothetical protein